MNYQSKVLKWGNSLGIRIQKSIAEQMELVENSEVELSVEGNALIVSPVRKKFSLSSLVDGITPENVHEETGWGGQEGREVW